MIKLDLHLHTNLSDGMLPPEEVVTIAKKNNCDFISITDHDLLKSYDELAKKFDITMLNGIEFNTSIRNLHILGYGIKNLHMIQDIMINLKRYNEKVCEKVILKMEKDGYDISIEKVIDYLKCIGLYFGILDKRKLAKYLIYKNYASNVLDTYQKLIGANQKYYVPNKKMCPEEIIRLIYESGGISVIAHPQTIPLEFDKLVNYIYYLHEMGLDGIEIFNGKVGSSIDLNLLNICNKLDMVSTVGSDFHDMNDDKIGIEIDEKITKKFCKKLTL